MQNPAPLSASDGGGPHNMNMNVAGNGGGSPPPPASATSKKTASAPKGSPTGAPKKKSTGRSSGSSTAIDYSRQRLLLEQCDWPELTVWSARQILGGNAINGFLKSTAAAQRIKKQRARQTKHSSAKAATNGPNSGLADAKPEAPPAPPSVPAPAGFDQAAEERLKKEIMNPRTAKKIKAEFEAGVGYCVAVHDLIRRLIAEVDPAQQIYLPPPLIPGPTQISTIPGISRQQDNGGQIGLSNFHSHIPHPMTGAGPGMIPKENTNRMTSVGEKSTTTPGTPAGSTLRKMRKKKIHIDPNPVPGLSEFDESGKRIFSKKEHQHRIFEALRFRPLKQGDFVAARVTSRDLWILARVLQDYDGFSIAPNEFLRLKETKRDALFRGKVIIKDVEEKDEGASNAVARSLVLPLPRTYSEASGWCQRCKKGTRVYAMYPQTTSLYSATVIDNTTYCREDDDVVVVEFDGEEPDALGNVPTYHIPARFVTIIPREFPASAQPSSFKASKRKSSTAADNQSASKRSRVQVQEQQMIDPVTDFLGDIDFTADGGLDNFDALELDFL